MTKYLTIEQAAGQLQISKATFYRRLKDEKPIPAYKVGRRTLIIEEELAAWVRSVKNEK